MSNYRKLVAGIVGVSIILLKHFAGIELPGLADHLVEIAMAVGTWVSMWWLRNEPPSRDSDQAKPISDVSEIGSLNAEVGNSRLPGEGE
jgi:hypothetical protein